MSTAPELAPPEPEREAPAPADGSLLQALESLLADRYGAALSAGERIAVAARSGPAAAWLCARVGDADRGMEFELFTRTMPKAAPNEADALLELLIDFLDGVLEEYFAAERDAFLPLDFSPRRYESHWIFARSEMRDYTAEAAADAWLAGAAPHHAIKGPMAED